MRASRSVTVFTKCGRLFDKLDDIVRRACKYIGDRKRSSLLDLLDLNLALAYLSFRSVSFRFSLIARSIF